MRRITIRRATGVQRGLAVLVTTSLAMGLAACGGNDDDSSSGSSNVSGVAEINEIFGAGGKAAGEGLTINDGMLLAMTGAGSFYGKVMKQGSELASEQIKAAGGPDFKITVADHKTGDVPAAVAGARKLISQDKSAIIQSSFGPVTQAIIPMLQAGKVLGFNGGGAELAQQEKDFLWLTRVFYGDDSAPGGLTWLAKENPKAKKLFVLGTAENGGNAMDNIVPKVWPQVQPGGEIVGNEKHTLGITDFKQIIAKIKASGADAIWTVTYANDIGYFMKQLRQAGIDIPVVGSEYTDQACKIAGDAFDTFTFAGDFFDPKSENPFAQQFTKAYNEKFGEDPELYGANYYEQLFLVWELVKRVEKSGGDPNSGADLQAAIAEKPEFPSVFGGGAGQVGTQKLDPKTHTVTKPMGVFSVKGCTPQQEAEIVKPEAGADPATSLVTK